MTDPSRPFRYAPELSPEDNANHRPGPEELWQESSFFFYCDPRSGLGGLQRIGMHPNKKESNVYTWSMVDGRLVSRKKLSALPLAETATTDTTLEGVTIATIEPCRRFAITVDRDDVRADIEWTSLPGPVTFPLDGSGKVVGRHHYNALGRATGKIAYQGAVHDFDGVGYMDHSWGPRDMSTVLGHSSIQAIFSDDFYVHTIVSWGPQGKVRRGYLCKDGELSHLAEIVASYTIGDDTYSPLGSELTVTDKLGRTLTMRATTVGETGLQPYGQGYFATQGMCTVETDGAQGAGFIEFSGPKAIPPAELATLGVDSDDWWLDRVTS